MPATVGAGCGWSGICQGRLERERLERDAEAWKVGARIHWLAARLDTGRGENKVGFVERIVLPGVGCVVYEDNCNW